MRFASLRVLTAMRALEVWESQVTTLIVSKAQALRELRSPHEQPKLLNTVIGDVAAPISRRVRTLLAKTIYDVSEAPASWLPTTDVPPPEPPPTPPVSPPSPPAPLLVGIPAMARSRAAASRALVPDAPGAVRTSFSAMLGGGYQPGAPSPSPPSPSPPPPSPPPPPFWTLLAQSPPPPAMRSHATSLNLESSELLADLLATVAAARSKCPPRLRPSSAPAAPQGAPGGSGRLGTPWARPSHWAPSHCLRCSSEPPPRSPPSPRRVSLQVAHQLNVSLPPLHYRYITVTLPLHPGGAPAQRQPAAGGGARLGCNPRCWRLQP